MGGGRCFVLAAAMLAGGVASTSAQAPATAAQPSGQGEPAAASARAFVEIAGLPAQAFVGQVVVLTVRVGFDAAWFAAQSVPLSAQALDQPFHVQVPWLRRDDDVRAEVAPAPAGAATERIAVGDRAERFAVVADRVVGGRTLAVRELRVRWQPLRAGAVELPPAVVRYAFATTFVEDFLRGRQPRDRQEATAASAATRCEVLDLPQPAPAGFAGAVGSFALAATPASSAGAVGQIVKTRVVVTGDGNLGAFAFALAEPLPGFHVDGAVAGDAAGEFVLDLLPLRAGVRELPPLAFVVFDPAARAYATVRSAPSPLAVAAPSGALPPRVQELVAGDAAAVAAAAPARTWPPLVAVAVALLVAGGARRRRQRARRARVQGAIDELLAVPMADAQARHAAYVRVLAIAAGLPTWSEAGWQILAGRASVAAVAALRAQVAALDAARYGGVAPTNDELATTLRAALG